MKAEAAAVLHRLMDWTAAVEFGAGLTDVRLDVDSEKRENRRERQVADGLVLIRHDFLLMIPPLISGAEPRVGCHA